MDTYREAPYTSRSEGFVVHRLLRSLIALGSRLSFVSIVSLSVFVAESCENGAACAEETCGEGGGGGATWTPGGSGVFCGPDGEKFECPANKCHENIRCSEFGYECTGDWVEGYQDHNACTIDECDPDTGEITHTELTAEDIDDGDDCTLDTCYPGGGVVHQDICGGA